MNAGIRLMSSLLALAAWASAGCSALGDKQKQSQLVGDTPGGSETPEGPGMKVAPAPLEPGAVAVSNFRQILGSMSSSVGISPPAECSALYRNAATTFPKYGEAKELTAPEESNKVSLAACVCNAVYAKEADPAYAASRVFLKGADFANGSSQAFLSGTVGDRLARSVWGRAADSSEQGAIQEMVAAIEPTLGGAARTPASLMNARFVGMCAIVLASYEAQAK